MIIASLDHPNLERNAQFHQKCKFSGEDELLLVCSFLILTVFLSEALISNAGYLFIFMAGIILMVLVFSITYALS